MKKEIWSWVGDMESIVAYDDGSIGIGQFSEQILLEGEILSAVKKAIEILPADKVKT